ncbi:MAG TPA: sensor domain-containing diguanylate cyclase [Jatrophihabitans sp.]|jgi:diguanylate cyclase (GGDEF)-like protein
MVDRDVIAATERDWYRARRRMRRLGIESAVLAVVLITSVSLVASFLAAHLASGLARCLVTGSLTLAAAVPLTGVVWYRIDRQQRLSNALMKTLRRQLKDAIDEVELESKRRTEQVRRQEFERRLAGALEMAEDEAQVVGVVEHALGQIAPDAASELLLADNSHAHLTRVASVAVDAEPPGCAVDSPERCPAARRSQVQRFDDSDAIDACPYLRGRPQGRCSAMCVPVSVLGRTVGVVHMVGAAGSTPDAAREHTLTTMADQVGARVGLLRVMAESQLQAATDSLTGLLNRRSMENRVRQLRATVDTIAVVVADLDHFKALNDTYGHETGDRALRLFAATLSSCLRREDLVSRHGGEEFVAVLPACSAARVRGLLDVVRARLAAGVVEHGLPAFTCSFGVAEAGPGEDFVAAVARADAALFDAKRRGRDRTVVHAGDDETPAAPLSVASA